MTAVHHGRCPPIDEELRFHIENQKLDAARYNRKGLNTQDMADTVYKLFNNTPRTENTV